MASVVPDILARIAGHKRSEIEALRPRRAEWERLAEQRLADRRDFAAALRARRPAVIAEIKQASPSKGLLAGQFDPAAIAPQYQAGGAAALSVLTDEPFFRGSLADLEAARSAVGLPVLRKDFTLDESQIVEAAAHGADAILLIAALHGTASLRRLREFAESWKLAVLVEVHDDAELQSAIDSGATILGVNNRDLRTFEVTLDTSLRLAGSMPAGALRVSESGIHSRAGVDLLLDAGYHAFLIGERLMRSGDPAAALRELTGQP
jgi:indole-3-glycerol phosphate synthase